MNKCECKNKELLQTKLEEAQKNFEQMKANIQFTAGQIKLLEELIECACKEEECECKAG
jgi:cell division protein FtsB